MMQATCGRSALADCRRFAGARLNYTSLVTHYVFRLLPACYYPLYSREQIERIQGDMFTRLNEAKESEKQQVWLRLIGISQSQFEQTLNTAARENGAPEFDLSTIHDTGSGAQSLSNFSAALRLLQTIASGGDPLAIRSQVRYERYAILESLRKNEQMLRVVLDSILLGYYPADTERRIRPFIELDA